jgi:membrane protein implicated in regulation of membrane protease activity
MLDALSEYAAVVWIGIALVLALIEAATLGLATIWFAIGAVAAMLVSVIGGGFLTQLIVFLVVSVILLYFTRPIALNKLKIGREKNFTEKMSGKRGLVTESILPFGSGLVKVSGIVWTAIGETPEATIERGVEVNVLRIEGVKIVVAPVEQQQAAL